MVSRRQIKMAINLLEKACQEDFVELKQELKDSLESAKNQLHHSDQAYKLLSADQGKSLSVYGFDDKFFSSLEVNHSSAVKNFIENWKLNFSDLVSKNIRGYLAYNKKINSGIYYRLLKEFEKPLIIEILNHTNNNQLLSSELLGINRNTLRKKMADYEIEIVRKATKN